MVFFTKYIMPHGQGKLTCLCTWEKKNKKQQEKATRENLDRVKPSEQW
jgi:hypothetical protein